MPRILPELAVDIAVPLPPSPTLELLIPNRAAVGDRILHYRIDRPIGEGGMGCVFEAFDERLERTVAIKVLKPHLAGRPDARDRFLSEAKALASVRHRNVVTVFAVEDASLPFIVMERLEGATVSALVEAEGVFTPLQAVGIGRQVASGLAAAHASGVLHRDIKPHNMVVENGVVKLLDFGLSVSLKQDVRSLGLEGTPCYIAPEQAQDEPMDERTDLYAVGVVLFRLLSGRFPFGNLPPSAALVAVATRDAPSLAVHTPSAPTDLTQLVDRLLAREPDQRIQTAFELEQRLAAIEAELQSGPLNKVLRAARNPKLWLTLAASTLPFLFGLFAVSAALPNRLAGKRVADTRPLSPNIEQARALADEPPNIAVEHQVVLPSQLRSWKVEAVSNNTGPNSSQPPPIIRTLVRFDLSAHQGLDGQRFLSETRLEISPAEFSGSSQLQWFLITDANGPVEEQRFLEEQRTLATVTTLNELGSEEPALRKGEARAAGLGDTGLSELGTMGTVDERLAGNSSFHQLNSDVLAEYLRTCTWPCSFYVATDASEQEQPIVATLKLMLSWHVDDGTRP